MKKILYLILSALYSTGAVSALDFPSPPGSGFNFNESGAQVGECVKVLSLGPVVFESDTCSGVGGAVDSINGLTGVVTIDPDDLDDSGSVNKFVTQAQIDKLAGIDPGAEVNHSNEELEDIISNMFTHTNHTNASVSYDDANGEIDITVTGGGAGLTQDQVEDFVAGLVVGGVGIDTPVYNDGAGTLTFSLSDERFTTVLKNKLDSIPADASNDQTGAEIVTAINSALGSTAWQTGGGGGGDGGNPNAIHLSDYNVSCDGSSDDKVKIQAFLTALQDGGIGDARGYGVCKVDSTGGGLTFVKSGLTEATILYWYGTELRDYNGTGFSLIKYEAPENSSKLFVYGQHVNQNTNVVAECGVEVHDARNMVFNDGWFQMGELTTHYMVLYDDESTAYQAGETITWPGGSGVVTEVETYTSDDNPFVEGALIFTTSGTDLPQDNEVITGGTSGAVGDAYLDAYGREGYAGLCFTSDDNFDGTYNFSASNLQFQDRNGGGQLAANCIKMNHANGTRINDSQFGNCSVGIHMDFDSDGNRTNNAVRIMGNSFESVNIGVLSDSEDGFSQNPGSSIWFNRFELLDIGILFAVEGNNSDQPTSHGGNYFVSNVTHGMLNLLDHSLSSWDINHINPQMHVDITTNMQLTGWGQEHPLTVQPFGGNKGIQLNNNQGGGVGNWVWISGNDSRLSGDNYDELHLTNIGSLSGDHNYSEDLSDTVVLTGTDIDVGLAMANNNYQPMVTCEANGIAWVTNKDENGFTINGPSGATCHWFVIRER